MELTNGILRLAPDRGGFVLAAALLGWGGLSVHCQTAAVLGGLRHLHAVVSAGQSHAGRCLGGAGGSGVELGDIAHMSCRFRQIVVS